MSESLLVDGKIPPHTPCPFRDKCNTELCHHTGEAHEVAFSCGLARGFDLIRAREGKGNE